MQDFFYIVVRNILERCIIRFEIFDCESCHGLAVDWSAPIALLLQLQSIDNGLIRLFGLLCVAVVRCSVVRCCIPLLTMLLLLLMLQMFIAGAISFGENKLDPFFWTLTWWSGTHVELTTRKSYLT